MPDNLNNLQIKRGLWWLDNRKKVNKIFGLLLILLCLVIMAFFIYQVVLYVNDEIKLGQYIEDISSERINYLGVLSDRGPLDILINEPQSILDSQGVYDLYAKVENLNPNWYATSCQYTFSFDGNNLEPEEIYFLPTETKYLVVKGYQTDEGTNSSQRDVSLIISDCNWQRQDLSGTPAVIFEIIDQDVIQSTSLDQSSLLANQNANTDIYGFPVDTNASLSGGALTQAYFKIINKSTYGFWDVQAVVMLEMGEGNVLALQKINLGKFESFETREIKVNWPKYYSRGVTAKIYLFTNNLSAENLISLGDLN